MMNKTAEELVSEIKKIQAYLKTCAEQITIIAQNTAPAETETAGSGET